MISGVGAGGDGCPPAPPPDDADEDAAEAAPPPRFSTRRAPPRGDTPPDGDEAPLPPLLLPPTAATAPPGSLAVRATESRMASQVTSSACAEGKPYAPVLAKWEMPTFSRMSVIMPP